MTTPEGWRRLVLDRREGEAIRIDGPARIVVVGFLDRRVRLAIEAPPETTVTRERRGE